ncbi:DUF2934 domain-containing protein [Azospirillum sp. A39]|uniref:DUF2934 domain-containing protein n=1 Tax=Azospirillum sp. A39 TaxID=3462279 RepID=UPI0040462230
MDDNRLDRIRQRAHEIWEREGNPHGRHDEHWAQAEAEIAAEDAAGNTAPAEAVPARKTRTAAPKAGPKGRTARGEAKGKAGTASTDMPAMTEGTTRRARSGDTAKSKDADAPAAAKPARKAAAAKAGPTRQGAESLAETATGKRAAAKTAPTAPSPGSASRGRAAKARGKDASM